MSELFDALAQKINKKDKRAAELLERDEIEHTIYHYCDEELQESGSEIFLEFDNNILYHVIEILSSESFQNRYEFEQIEPTIFGIRERVVDIF